MSNGQFAGDDAKEHPRSMHAVLDESLERMYRLLRRARLWTLALCFWVWLLVGAGILLGFSGNQLDADSGTFHTLLPMWVRAAEWIIPSLLILVTMVTGKFARISVPLLVIGPMVRIPSYAWAWLIDFIPGEPDGYGPGWYVALLHVPFLGLVVLAALLTSEDRHR